MPQPRLFSQAARKVADKAVTREIHRLAEKVRANGGQPLDLVLPDGSQLNFGREPCAYWQSTT